MADEEKDALLPIAHPFTLDKRWSEFNEDRPPGFMAQLKNYIPQNHVLKTRKGIVSLAHTPEGTMPWNPETLSAGTTVTAGLSAGDTDFAVLQGILNFNTTTQTALGTNIIAPYDLIYMSAVYSLNYAGGAVPSNSYITPKEGTHSLLTTNQTAYVSSSGNPARTYGVRTSNMEFMAKTWMPGHSAQNTSFMITYWLYPFRANAAANAEWHFSFGDAQAKGSGAVIMLRHFDRQFQCSYKGQNPTGFTSLNLSSDSTKQDEWNFFAFWVDWGAGFDGTYKWNSDGEAWNINNRTPNANFFWVSSSYNTINANMSWDAGAGQLICDASDAFSGLYDYITFWSKPYHLNNTSNITLLRIIRAMAWVT